jgi:hypothetical protein
MGGTADERRSTPMTATDGDDDELLPHRHRDTEVHREEGVD